MKTWVTADTHFFHANILKYCKRPWSSVEDMNAALIINWNAIVGPDDLVYVLGDVSFAGPKKTVQILKQLNATKRLILGNHDKHNAKNDQFRACFEWIKDYYELTYNDKLYVLSHYPFHSWLGSNRGTSNLAGHSHFNIDNSQIMRLDCGVDNPDAHYAPMLMDDIERMMDDKRKSLKHHKTGFDSYLAQRLKDRKFWWLFWFNCLCIRLKDWIVRLSR